MSRITNLCADCGHGKKVNTKREKFECAITQSYIPTPPSHCLYYNGPRFPIDVVIICAVHVEREAVLNYLHPDGEVAWKPVTTIEDGLWRSCRYKSTGDSEASVGIACTKTRMTGLTAAASLTSLAIQLFRPSHIVMLGITAGRQSETQIGDIVVPLELWDHGAGRWEEEEGGQLRFRPRGARQPIDEYVRQWCDELADRRADLINIRDSWAARYPDRPAYSSPKVKIAPMVSGAAVVDAEEIWQRVLDQNDKVLAIDMEAYGVALAAHCAATPQYRPYCLVAKSVCDYGVRKEKDAQPYAAFTSTRFFKMYLDEFILGDASKRSPMRTNIPKTDQ